MPGSYVLVTVGSTKFEELIKAIDTPLFLDKIKRKGYTGVHIQIGDSKYYPTAISKSSDVKVFRYTNEWDQEVSESGLVLGHAGAGTILDSLERRKPIIVVANTNLMANHQTDISDVMTSMGYTLSSPLSNLVENIEKLCDNVSTLIAFPTSESDQFRKSIDLLFL